MLAKNYNNVSEMILDFKEIVPQEVVGEWDGCDYTSIFWEQGNCFVPPEILSNKDNASTFEAFKAYLKKYADDLNFKNGSKEPGYIESKDGNDVLIYTGVCAEQAKITAWLPMLFSCNKLGWVVTFPEYKEICKSYFNSVNAFEAMKVLIS